MTEPTAAPAPAPAVSSPAPGAISSSSFTQAPIAGSAGILPSSSFAQTPAAAIPDTPLAKPDLVGGQEPLDKATLDRLAFDPKPIAEDCHTCKNGRKQRSPFDPSRFKNVDEVGPLAGKPVPELEKNFSDPVTVAQTNFKSSGSYASVSMSGFGASGTWTHVIDNEGVNHFYFSDAKGVTGPGAGFSAGDWGSTGSADDYWLGKGYGVAKGPVEYGWNGSGYNAGVTASITPSKWNPFNFTATETNTTPSSFLNRMFGGPQH